MLHDRVFFTRKSARFYAFRYKSTPSTALPSMLARTKICKRTRSDYRLFPLWFTVPLVFQLKLKPYTAYMALCSVFLAYIFLKFDHNNQKNIVIKFQPRMKASRASDPLLFIKPAGRPAIAKLGSFPVRVLFANFDSLSCDLKLSDFNISSFKKINNLKIQFICLKISNSMF